MRKLTAECSEIAVATLGETDNPGFCLAVDLLCAGNEDVPVSGAFLARKGIKAFPEFAEGFGFDQSCHTWVATRALPNQIGRASCRERV